MEREEYFMVQALAEAKKAEGRTSPNPCVGAVIVRDDRIIARGYHKKAGTPHAERNAIAAAKEYGETLRGAEIYVTLEPCSHTGRTPPCCEAIIEEGFARVVAGMGDPNPQVNGRGLARLKDAGIEVLCGVLEEECYAINRPFITYITTGMPHVIMKAGVSLDGRLSYQSGRSGWITGEESSREVHRLRDRCDALLVGRGTAVIDDPALTTRLPKSEEQSKGRSARDPLRVVLDSRLQISPQAKLLRQKSHAKSIIFCGEDVPPQKKEQIIKSGAEVISVPAEGRGGGEPGRGLNLKAVLQELGRREICSLLVEGGGEIHRAFLSASLYDEAYLFYAPLFAGVAGVPLLDGLQVASREYAPRLYQTTLTPCGEDFLLHGFFSPPAVSCP